MRGAIGGSQLGPSSAPAVSPHIVASWTVKANCQLDIPSDPIPFLNQLNLDTCNHIEHMNCKFILLHNFVRHKRLTRWPFGIALLRFAYLNEVRLWVGRKTSRTSYVFRSLARARGPSALISQLIKVQTNKRNSLSLSDRKKTKNDQTNERRSDNNNISGPSPDRNAQQRCV